ncbi:unnamed protein product [Gongylonema pulchrum]|uniref:DNA methylase n=1 Tax=Gongylonema pulchrum TaxID=637853 RepID=A0A183ECZ0_9BILA|nr:unnamed protein product [Gongylonema pulchrum]
MYRIIGRHLLGLHGPLAIFDAMAGAGAARHLQYDCFADRHIGPSDIEKQLMLNYLGFKVSFVIKKF